MTPAAPTHPLAVPFDLGHLPLLAAGQSRHRLVAGERLIGHAMVIAEGGENNLHAHQNEEHIFLVLSGQARFEFLPPQDPVLLGPLQGILLPSGCFYRFCSVGQQNLIFARVGTTRGPDASRVGVDGQYLRGNSAEAGWKPGSPDPNGRIVAQLFRDSQLG